MAEGWERARARRVLGLRRSNFLLALYVVGYLAYLVTGGAVFAALEAPGELELTQQLIRARKNFIANHPCVSESDLEELIDEVVKASDRGVSAAHNVSGEPNWSFGQSLFFSSTVVTTIGYGHVTPLSKGGKVFCMIYAMIGIPLTLILLTALVERLMLPTTLFLQYLNSRLGHLYNPFSIRVLHLGIISSTLIALLILLPAGAFAYIEPDWDYLDSLYYCFISLTTVGLGDYIPGDHPNQPYRPLYKVATTGYLLVGLTFMMLTLTIFYEIPELNIGLFFLMKSDEKTLDPEKVRLQPGGGSAKYVVKGTSGYITNASAAVPTYTAGIPAQPSANQHSNQETTKESSPEEDEDSDMMPVHAIP